MHAHFRSALIGNLVIIIFFLQLEVNFIPEKELLFKGQSSSPCLFEILLFIWNSDSFDLACSVVTPLQNQMHQSSQYSAARKEPKGLEM